MPNYQPTSFTRELAQQIEHARVEAARLAQAPGQRIHVSEITSLPAFAYEKLRNIVDYKDEYLLRKNAIRRFLKRRIVLPKFGGNPDKAALGLVRDLVLARYLPNDTMLESAVLELGKILEKYYRLLAEVASRGCHVSHWREIVLGIAAVECDAYLVSPLERHAYASYAYHLLKPALALTDSPETDEVKNVQLVISLQRVLERADRDIIMYYLLRHYYHDWFTLPPPEAAGLLAPKLEAVLTAFQRTLEHRLGRRLLPRVRRLLTPVLIMRDLIHTSSSPPTELLVRPSRLEHLARETYVKVWRATRKRVRRKGFHAMVYIFLTKMLLAILIELPYERFVLGAIHYLPVAINLLFPPFLMAVITLLIKSPGARNRETVVAAVNEAAYGSESSFYAPHRLKTSPPTLWRRLGFVLLYFLTMGITFSVLVDVLSKLGFNVLSGALFVFFVSLVSFFGLSLREQARQLKVVVGRDNLLSFVVDFFTLPIVAFGKWLSITFDRINIFVFILDYLFEIPFKTLLRVIEDWFAFLKERKEEMY